MRFRAVVMILFLAAASAVPVSAQFSDSYNFIKAVRDKDVNKARDILDKPGSTAVNVREPSTGDAPLHIVIRQRDLAWVGFLLQANADPNIRDRDGNTPLLLASVSRFSEAVRVLVAIRAGIDLKNNAGETPLIKAVQANDLVDAKVLLDAGANPDVTDNAAGYSARDYATQHGGQIAKMLADAPKRTKAPVQGPPR